jgi:hypothetical protein
MMYESQSKHLTIQPAAWKRKIHLQLETKIQSQLAKRLHPHIQILGEGGLKHKCPNNPNTVKDWDWTTHHHTNTGRNIIFGGGGVGQN